MSSKSVDMGPRALLTDEGSPFRLSVKQWTLIQDYVTDVLASPQTVSIAQDYPIFRDLRRACVSWQQSTFPAILNLADDVYRYGTVTVQEKYPEIARLIPVLESGNPPQDTVDEFSQMIADLGRETQRNERAAEDIIPQIVAFGDINTQANIEREALIKRKHDFFQANNLGRFEQALQELSAEYQNAIGVIQKIRGVWGAIAYDLTDLDDWIKTQLADHTSILLDLALEQARTSWQTVGEEAYDFTMNV